MLIGNPVGQVSVKNVCNPGDLFILTILFKLFYVFRTSV